MGYATSVDTGQVVPLALYNGETGQTASAAPGATIVSLVGVTLYAPAVLTGIRVRFAVGGNGHYDVGIYDATGTNSGPGNLLAHAAATSSTLITSAATLTPSFINGNISLSPGRYWLALWTENGSDTVNKQTGSGNVVVAMSGTNAGPLPALASSISSLANNGLEVILIGMLSGGWT